MKYFLPAVLLCFFITQSFAQNSDRKIMFRESADNGVILPLNEDYNLIEDSCARILRYVHFDFDQKKFFGKFRDVSILDTNLVVAEGNYNENGLKDGAFTSYYLNGNLQAKGNFKDDHYNGKWKIYYENGKPQVTFEVVDGGLHIINAWKADGTKTVDNGNGAYIADLGGAYWKGNLVSGRPDGKWELWGNSDITNTPLSTEHFKKGNFRNGSVAISNIDYTDASRIQLVNPYRLPFVNAERMAISPIPCNGTKHKHIVNAQYKDGFSNFSEAIKNAVLPYLSKIKMPKYSNTIDITGVVFENGSIGNLESNHDSLKEFLSEGIITGLKTLPLLHPATVDGKPVKQKFVIHFIFHNGFYQCNYNFLKIEES